MSAQGTDAKGRGGANAASVFRLEPAGSGSKVLVHTNLTLSGAVAQYGRGVGIIQATATQIMNQFAKCLKDKLAQEPSRLQRFLRQCNPRRPSFRRAPRPLRRSRHPRHRHDPPQRRRPAPPPAKPISGFSLLTQVFWSWLTGLFKRS